MRYWGGAPPMHILGVLFEVLGAFFLAVEAIKTANLLKLGRMMHSVALALRRFHTRDEFTFRMSGALLSMLVLLGLVISRIDVPLPAVMLIQVVSSLALILFVLSLERIAAGLNWIERNTASGVVGITGFLLYVLGVLVRESFH
jgi:hypothetical protein